MQNDKRFYTTTPIYYVNGKPHVGTSYTHDHRGHRLPLRALYGPRCPMVTGSDEHSQNIVDLATPRARPRCSSATRSSRVSTRPGRPSAFSPTSSNAPATPGTTIWCARVQRIYNRGDIYKGSYSGWYHTSDNRFLDEDEVPKDPE